MPANPARLRRPAIALALTAALAVLTACTAAPGAAPTGDAPSTYTVSTMYGDVTVPAGAQRIVALSFPEATALVDLGVTPVGIGGYEPDFPAYNDAFKGLPDVTDSAGAPDLEKIAALHPDLIITDVFASDVEKERPTYEQLTAIAPTVVVEWTQAAGNWPADAAGTAAAIGRTKQLDALKAAYEQKAADIKSKYADVLASHTVDLISGDATNWYLYSGSSSHGRVLVDAGAVLNAAAGQQDGFIQESPEQLDVVKDSSILVIEQSSVEPLESLPNFSTLDAAKSANVFPTNHFFPSSYGIAEALLDDFANILEQVK